MQRACDRYTDIFGTAPLAHGAAGWQMNVHALRLTQRLGFEYCSDGRGAHPHLPVWNGELIRCPQLPTTLPTLDELIGRDGITETNVAAHLLERTKAAPPRARLHAARRARRHAPRAGLRAAPRRLEGAGLAARVHADAPRYAAAARAAALRSRSRRRRRALRHGAACSATSSWPTSISDRTGVRGARERSHPARVADDRPWISPRSRRTVRSARCSSSSSRSRRAMDGGEAARCIRGRSRCRR